MVHGLGSTSSERVSTLSNCPSCGRSSPASQGMICPFCGWKSEAGKAGSLDANPLFKGAAELSQALGAEGQLQAQSEGAAPPDPLSPAELLNPEEVEQALAYARASKQATAATELEAQIAKSSNNAHAGGKDAHGVSEEEAVFSEDEQDGGVTIQAAGLGGAPNTGGVPEGVVDESELSAEELAELRELQERDREVRAHEQAHISAGAGIVTGGASYSYQTGPDGKQYAVGGEVGIDASPVAGNPEETMRKAQQIRRAAMAPASPSAQDQSVASRAAQMEAEARTEKLQKDREEAEEEQNVSGAAAVGGAESVQENAGEISENEGVASTEHSESGLGSGETFTKQESSRDGDRTDSLPHRDAINTRTRKVRMYAAAQAQEPYPEHEAHRSPLGFA